MTTITDLPVAPNPLTDDQPTFNSRALAFTQALPGMVTQMNAVAGEVNAANASAVASANTATGAQTSASNSATAASASATSAANSAASASASAAAAAGGVLGDIGPATHAAAGKATPVDADELPVSDSAAAFALKKLTWANLKATLKAYFDTLYGALGAANSWTAKQTVSATLKLQQVLEKTTITASAPTGAFDCLTQGIQYFTTAASANWTQNFRGDGTNSLDSIMAVGESITLTILATQGATPYYPNAHQVDGSAVTPKWLGGSAPTSGDASSINVYSYTLTKTAAATFTVLASKSKYA